LRGKLRGETFALDVPVELGSGARPALGKLWAKERIHDLEGADMSGRRAAANKSRIVKLAVEHQIASAFTSFVVVEKRTGDRRASGVPETRVVPVHTPADWEMFGKKAKDQMRTAARSRSYGAVPVTGPRPSRPAAMPMTQKAPAPMMAPRPAAGRVADMPTGAPPPPSGVASAEQLPRSISLRSPAAPADFGAADDMEAARSYASRVVHLERDTERPPAQHDPVVALLSRQLASGMWDDPQAGGPEEVRRVRATARALVELFRLGITTAHATYGAQVKKAVEALVEKAVAVAAQEPRVAELALAIAWLTAAGPRTRGAIERLVQGTASLGGLAGRLDEAALRADLDRLATA